MAKKVQFVSLGVRPYREVLAYQEKLRGKRIKGEICDTVIFCEHPPVYTVGKRDCDADWLSDSDTIFRDGIEIVKTDRGGRITYHGPGQLIAYFIFNIAEVGLGVKDFVQRVEEVVLATVSRFGVEAVRDSKYPGLWVNGKKLVAVGFNITKNVSMHGIALNVSPEIGHYRHIVPCGIKGGGVTSLAELMPKAPTVGEVSAELQKTITELF
jgi:lipoate-protein ligase B